MSSIFFTGFGLGASFQLFTQSDGQPGVYADAAARDLYFGANPSDLARLDANQFLIIRLDDDGTGAVAYQQRALGIFVNVTSLVQGDPGAQFDTVPIGAVPVKANLNNDFESSGALVDPVKKWDFQNSITVPSGSIQVGEVLQLSEGITDLAIIDLIDRTFGFSVNVPFDPVLGSSPPTFNDFGPSFQLIIQGVDSDVLTDNPLQFSLTGTVAPPDVRVVEKITLRANGAMTNVRIRIRDQVSGLTIRYIPNKASWDAGENGVSFIIGDNIIYFADDQPDTPGNIYIGYVPFLINGGQVVDIDVAADSVDLLGTSAPIPPLVTRAITSGVPYLVADNHDGPPVELLTGATAGDVQGPLPSVDTELTLYDGITGKIIQGGSQILAGVGIDAAALTFGSSQLTGVITLSFESSLAVQMAALQIDEGNAGRVSLSSIESLYLLPSDTGEVRILKAGGADTDPLLRLEDGGANGGVSEHFVGNRNPLGFVKAEGGAVYYGNNGEQSDIFFKRSPISDVTGWDTLIGVPSYASVSRSTAAGGASRSLSTTPTLLDIWTVNGPDLGNLQGDFATDTIGFNSVLDKVNGDVYQLQTAINFTLTRNDEVTFEVFYDAGFGEVSTGLVSSLKSTKSDNTFGASGSGNFRGPLAITGSPVFYVKFSSLTSGTITFIQSNLIIMRLR